MLLYCGFSYSRCGRDRNIANYDFASLLTFARRLEEVGRGISAKVVSLENELMIQLQENKILEKDTQDSKAWIAKMEAGP